MISSSVVNKGLTASRHLRLCEMESVSRRLSVICSALLILVLILEVWQVEIRVKIVKSVIGLDHEVLELVLVHALLIIVTIFH